MGYFLNVLQRQPLQIIRIILHNKKAHKVRTGVQLQADRSINKRPRQRHQLLQRLRQLRSALVRRLEERNQRDVRREVVRPIPAAKFPRLRPEVLQLLQKRSRRARVQDVLPWRTLVQRRIVDMGQQPIGGQLHATISGRRQRLLPSESRKRGQKAFTFT